MTISVRRKGQVHILDLGGKVTIGDGNVLLRKTFLDLLGEGAQLFVLNLHEVSFVDSAGIGEMVACYKRAGERKGTVKILIERPSRAHDMFILSKLDQVFELFTDEDEAITSFIRLPGRENLT